MSWKIACLSPNFALRTCLRNSVYFYFLTKILAGKTFIRWSYWGFIPNPETYGFKDFPFAAKDVCGIGQIVVKYRRHIHNMDFYGEGACQSWTLLQNSYNEIDNKITLNVRFANFYLYLLHLIYSNVPVKLRRMKEGLG